MRAANHFQKHLLPSPRAFYADALGKLTRPSRGWSRGNCPFHESKSKSSFSVNVDNGAFYCFGCGVKGGDLVAFLMLRDKVPFPEACKRLGAWDDRAKPIKQRRAEQREVVGRDLVFRFKIDGERYQALVADDPEDWLQLLRRCYHMATDRLDEIAAGSPEEYDGEIDVLWEVMADSFELIREEEQAVSHG